jgi:hypothetical protein
MKVPIIQAGQAVAIATIAASKQMMEGGFQAVQKRADGKSVPP